MKNAAVYTVLAAGAVIATFPFLWMTLTAFKSYAEASSPTLQLLPSTWHWENFAATFRAAPFAVYFLNTAVVTFAVTSGVLITAICAGYALGRLEFPGRGLVFALILSTMMIPFEVTLIPNFILIHRFGWYNSYAALTVPWLANAFSIFLMRQAFLGLPSDYFDAAKVDGCGRLRFLVWVGAPLVKPMVITVALFAFLGSYNALLWPLIVTGTDDMRVVQVALTAFASDEGVRFNLLMCASTIVILPTVILYFAAQRYFLESALGAGIKG